MLFYMKMMDFCAKGPVPAPGLEPQCPPHSHEDDHEDGVCLCDRGYVVNTTTIQGTIQGTGESCEKQIDCTHIPHSHFEPPDW